jgi:hypothetical protein
MRQDPALCHSSKRRSASQSLTAYLRERADFLAYRRIVPGVRPRQPSTEDRRVTRCDSDDCDSVHCCVATVAVASSGTFIAKNSIQFRGNRVTARAATHRPIIAVGDRAPRLCVTVSPSNFAARQHTIRVNVRGYGGINDCRQRPGRPMRAPAASICCSWTCPNFDVIQSNSHLGPRTDQRQREESPRERIISWRRTRI